jgi:hypothetical protein
VEMACSVAQRSSEWWLFGWRLTGRAYGEVGGGGEIFSHLPKYLRPLVLETRRRMIH